MTEYGDAARIFTVRGRKALVSGGSKGIGKEMARCLLENGCDVYVAARDAAAGEDLLETAAASGSKAHFYSCDIARDGAASAMVARAAETLGRIDILINSAGMNAVRFLVDLDENSWDRVFRLNIRALFLVTREAAKIMKAQHYGKIINLSSMKSFLGTSAEGYSAYCASKGAVNMFTRQAACELAAHAVTVNAIAPTFIKTAINAAQLENPGYRAALEARIPVGRIGRFKDIMGLTLLLASDASEFITGQIFKLDGGISARQ